MPELPEVHTISTDLKNNILGWTIKGVKVFGGYKTLPSNSIFTKVVEGQKISGVSRIAKNILIHLESGNSILIHLAMTGQVLVRKPTDKSDRWMRVVFDLGNKDKKLSLRFCDMRMFGKVAAINEKGIIGLRSKYGPEPLHLDESKTAGDFFEKIKTKRSTIKNVLLDQSIVSGLGNIYATDALFLAKIHPETSTQNITLEQVSILISEAKTVLLEGIKHRGSTLGDKMYVDAFGNYGTHQNYFKIYGKEKCPNCQTKVEFKKINGRGTYFCPTCQVLNGNLRLL